jgi:hypothetical protein
VQSAMMYAGVNNTCTGAHFEALRARALNLRIKDQAGTTDHEPQPILYHFLTLLVEVIIVQLLNASDRI